MAVPTRTLTIANVLPRALTIKVVSLIDRRAPDSEPQEWLLQTDLEDLLYPSTTALGTSGAFYRLLGRSQAGNGMALPLRRNSVAAGLVTEAEFDALKALLHAGVRAFTLVPIPAVAFALATYGPTAASEALLAALGLPRPPEWTVSSESEDEEEDDDDDEEDDEEEDEEDEDEEEDEEDSGSGGRSRSPDSSDERPSSEEGDGDNSSASSGRHGKRKRRESVEMTPELQAQFDAFDRFRMAVVNRHRKGTAVVASTVGEDRSSILHFFAWLQRVKGVGRPSFNLFSKPQIAVVAQSFAEEKALTCKYSRVSKLLGSLVAAARFTHAMLRAKSDATVDTTAVDQLVALHTQALSEARQQSKFDTVKPPKAWLDWSACQRARLSAERVVAACDAEAAASEKLELVRDCCLLTLFTALPPDRVGVYRQLKLGSTLKIVGDRVQIDLSERGAHKTAAIFGPSRTTLTATVATRIRDLVNLDALQPDEYLFHGKERHSPLSPSAWTRLVQATFKAHSGVALSPKECRSSFVTWLRDGEHGDETLRAAALAMRHSSAMADSAAYDKHGTDRVVAAAVEAADAFAARFAL